MRTSHRNWVLRPCIGLMALAASLALATCGRAAILIVDDSFADGGRNNGADPLDTNWWTSTSTSATTGSIEVSTGSLGLVTGTSGRGIHGTFAPQSLSVGQAIRATFTFATPATVGSNLSSAFRVALFNRQNNPALEADLAASTGSPNALYNPLAGYMADFDVNQAANDINIREKKTTVPGSTGQLLGTTTGYSSLANGGDNYAFTANTTYTGVFQIYRIASGLSLTASLSGPSGLLSTFITSDATPNANALAYDMLAFHANTNAFGNNGTVGQSNNGIDFSNIRIEFRTPGIPEPASCVLLGIGCTLAVAGRWRK